MQVQPIPLSAVSQGYRFEEVHKNHVELKIELSECRQMTRTTYTCLTLFSLVDLNQGELQDLFLFVKDEGSIKAD